MGSKASKASKSAEASKAAKTVPKEQDEVKVPRVPESQWDALPSPLNQVSLDVWSYVFGMLSSKPDRASVPRVCRLWRTVVLRKPPASWRILRFIGTDPAVMVHMLRTPAYGGTRTLIIDNPSSRFSPEQMDMVTSSLPQVSTVMLSWFDLRGTMPPMAWIGHLVTLSLVGCTLSVHSRIALQKLLRGCVTLRSLNLMYTSLTDAVKGVPMFGGMKGALEHLNVALNPTLTPAVFNDLQPFANVCNLDMSHNKALAAAVPDLGKAVASGSVPLRSWNLSAIPLTAYNLSHVFHGCCTLRSLFLDHSELGSEGAEQLAEVEGLVTSLRELSVSRNVLNDGALLSIAKFKGLTSLDVSQNTSITDSGMAHVLCSCVQLQALHMRCLTKLTRATVTLALEKLPYLAVVDTEGARDVTAFPHKLYKQFQ